jgi:membrane-bound lytic murein transglycosylase A
MACFASLCSSFRILRIASALLALPLFAACEIFPVEPTNRTPRAVEEPDWGAELPPGEMALEKMPDPSTWPDFGVGFGEKDSLLRAIDASLEYMAKPSSDTFFPYGPNDPDLNISHDRTKRSLEAFRNVVVTANSPEQMNQMVREQFEVFRSKGLRLKNGENTGRVLYTGYHTPIYDASPTQTAEFKYPLYKRPPELITDPITGECRGWGTEGAPSPTREDFDNGALAGKGLEYFFLKSKLDAYIIHVQGSGKLRLPSGQIVTVGYHGKTEQPYEGLGSSLVKDGKVGKGELSLFKVREYFANNPGDLDTYMNRNKSYIFFTDAEGGPFGCINAPVTAHRTIATDEKVFPRTGVTFVQTSAPHPNGTNDYQQWMLDQDTGGAIRSANRADLYMGVGDQAEHAAGGTLAEGKLWYIFVK